MNYKQLLIAFVLLCAFLAGLFSPVGSGKDNSSKSCGCLTDFDAMVKSVTMNYAGYDGKINGHNKSKFEEITRRLRSKAAAAGESDCGTVLSEWTDFFQDGHLRVRSVEYFDSFAKHFAENPRTPSIQVLDSNFIVLRIPTFHESKTALDKILEENKLKIASTPHLVIDLRGNDGGSDWTYTNLIPLLYTGPITTVAGGVRSSEASIRYFERFVNTSNPSETPRWVADLLVKLRQRKGKVVTGDGERIEMDLVQSNPTHIAILIDGTNMSSAETFLLKARQSKKVKLFGSNTKGVVDYLNPVFETLPCRKLVLATPLVKRSMKLPDDAIDNVGIPPDVRISGEVKDKIQFIVDYYKRRTSLNTTHSTFAHEDLYIAN